MKPCEYFTPLYIPTSCTVKPGTEMGIYFIPTVKHGSGSIMLSVSFEVLVFFLTDAHNNFSHFNNFFLTKP